MPNSFRKHTMASIKRMAEDMLLRNMAIRTIDSYTYHVSRFSKHFGKLPEDLGPEEIREFQLWMIQETKCSWSSFNQAVCGLRFLYTYTLPRPWVVTMIPFGNRPKKLPVVLGQEEVHRLIECVTVPKHRAVLLTLYAAGLRLSEATNLSQEFSKRFLRKLKSLHRRGKLELEGGLTDLQEPLAWSKFTDTHQEALFIATAVTVGRYIPLAKTVTWASLIGTKSTAEHLWCLLKSLPSSLAIR